MRMERVEGFEPSTFGLADRRSTPELHPHTIRIFVCSVGADRGNRTLVFCLEGSGSTIELHPRFNTYDHVRSMWLLVISRWTVLAC